MRYKVKSVASLQTLLGSWPDRMRVEVDRDVGKLRHEILGTQFRHRAHGEERSFAWSVRYGRPFISLCCGLRRFACSLSLFRLQ